MSRSFVESVINVDQIWDEDTCTSTSNKRFSRYYTKSKRSSAGTKPTISDAKSEPDPRRHSVPSNVAKLYVNYPNINGFKFGVYIMYKCENI